MKCARRLVGYLFLLTWTCSLQAGLWNQITSYWGKQEPAAPPKLQVLIVHDKPGAMIEVKGKYHLYDPNDNSIITTRFVGKGRYMQPLQGGLKWGEEFPGQYQLLIRPDNASITTLVDGIEYKGNIYVYDIGGSISIVNSVDVEDYLKSTLAEMTFDHSLSEEVVAAIVIAARTNAYYAVTHPRTAFWTVDANKVGYTGSVNAHPKAQIVKAIDATKGMVLTQKTPNITEAISGVFLADFAGLALSASVKDNLVVSTIDIEKANDMAKRGSHAAQILSRAFPDTSITLMDQTRN